MGKSKSLEVDSENIEELVEDHATKLTKEEFVHLQNKQQKNLAKEQSFQEKEEIEDIPSFLIKQICAKWDDGQSLGEKNTQIL